MGLILLLLWCILFVAWINHLYDEHKNKSKQEEECIWEKRRADLVALIDQKIGESKSAKEEK